MSLHVGVLLTSFRGTRNGLSKRTKASTVKLNMFILNFQCSLKSGASTSFKKVVTVRSKFIVDVTSIMLAKNKQMLSADQQLFPA